MQAHTFFQEKITDLQQRLKTSLEDFTIQNYSYLVKGDISGIQDFIFSVSSSKASKSLKGRSFFVQALSKLGIRLLQVELGEANTRVFYDGGGNFYLLSKVPVKTAIEKANAIIARDCQSSEIYLSLTGMAIGRSTFSEVWQTVNQRSNEAKLRKFEIDFLAFNPYLLDLENPDFEYDKLTDNSLRRFNGRYHFDAPSQAGVDDLGVAFFGSKMILNQGKTPMEDWVNGLPMKKESRAIVEFSDLALAALTRTGTEKLAVLKMDVDNLGLLFGGLKDWTGGKKASAAMSWFFGAFMSELLETNFQYKDETGTILTARFSDNIYVVFSGGDDTFMVGAWDAVFEFAHCFHRNFTDFVAELKSQKIDGLPENLTLSAALVVVDPKFPVVRFADRAEEALSEAKRWGSGKGKYAPKNRISVFGQILEWQEFGDSRDMGQYLAGMIQSNVASRGIIERIKKIAHDYERLADRAASQQNVPGPKVHRLFYTLKKWTPAAGKEENAKTADEKFIEKTAHDFTNGLLQSFTKGQKVSYPKFPVAARWAEFLTRK